MNHRVSSGTWQYALLAALTLVCFGGPFLVMVVVRGGASPEWPPDRPLEWFTIGGVLVLFAVLFLACVTISWWAPPPRRGKTPSGQ
jgi:hypothetical protein